MTDHAILDLKCQYCGERCFLPLLETWLHGSGSLQAAAAFISRKVNMVATCKQGQKAERALIGYSYDNLTRA